MGFEAYKRTEYREQTCEIVRLKEYNDRKFRMGHKKTDKERAEEGLSDEKEQYRAIKKAPERSR